MKVVFKQPMSREALANFVRATEHSASLRQELRKCNDISSLLKLAHSYGFKVTVEDLKNEEKLAKIDKWFMTSKISPFLRSLE